MRSIRSSNRPALLPWLAWLLATSPALAADVPEIAMAQASESDGTPLPRPMVGVAAPDAATLPFNLELTYQCPAGTGHRQLFVSIADSWSLEDAPGTPSPWILHVDVPVRQLQWLMQPDKECASEQDRRAPDEVDGSGIRYFRLHTSAAGYAMLTCTAKDGKASTATVTAPLDVWLSCPAGAPAPSAAP